MKKQLKNRIISFCSVISILSTVTATNASATSYHYQGSIKRGTDKVASVKTTFNWQVDDYDITNSNAYQVSKGIMVGGKGTHRTYAGGIEHDWTAISECVIGVTIKGFKLGYTITYEDKVELFNSGNLYVKWDN